jgi:hypothetical protein
VFKTFLQRWAADCLVSVALHICVTLISIHMYLQHYILENTGLNMPVLSVNKRSRRVMEDNTELILISCDGVK